MMRRRVVYPVLLAALVSASGTVVRAQSNGDVAVTNLEGQPRYSADQIDNLTGPIALYPDALLAQVLVASTFPDQISDAAAYVRSNGTANIDAQQWDISVKAVAHYPSALNAMADKLDWTTALGTAYASQSSEVMQSIQRLRALASANGNLNTTSQQQVITQGSTYEIVPVQPQVIYVPVYDPYVIYSRPIFNLGLTSRYWSFGVGFPIGGWLSYDCDWGLQRVYYNGWAPSYYAYAGNWRARSRPYVRLTDIYVSPRYRNVYVNRTVVTRYVDYRNVDRYASVHRDTHFEGRYDNRDARREGNGSNNGRPVNGGGYQSPRGGNNGNNDVRNGNNDVRNGNNDGRNGNGNNEGRNSRGNGSGRGNGGNINGSSGNVRGGAQNPGTAGRVAVPRDRRNEPATRTDGSQPQLVVPQRAPEQPQRGGDQPQRSGDQQRNGGRQYDIQQRGAPQQQAQEQRRAQPAPEQQRQAPSQGARVEPQRQAPSQGARVEPQRQAPQVQQKAEPQKGRTAEPRGRGGDGKGSDRGDRGNHRG